MYLKIQIHLKQLSHHITNSFDILLKPLTAALFHVSRLYNTKRETRSKLKEIHHKQST